MIKYFYILLLITSCQHQKEEKIKRLQAELDSLKINKKEPMVTTKMNSDTNAALIKIILIHLLNW